MPAIASAASATFNPNTDCQDHTCSSRPVVSRPRTALPPATPAQTPTARVRWAGGNVLVIVDNVAGITNAAPSPSTPRNAMSALAD